MEKRLKKDRMFALALDNLLTRTHVVIQGGHYITSVQVVVLGIMRRVSPEKVCWAEATYRDAHTPLQVNEDSLPFTLDWNAQRRTEDEFERFALHAGSGGKYPERGPHLDRVPLWKKPVRHLVVLEEGFRGSSKLICEYDRFDDTQVTDRFLEILSAMRGRLGAGKRLNDASSEFKALDYELAATIDHVKREARKPIMQLPRAYDIEIETKM